MAEDYAVTETLYLDQGKERVLKEDDPQAAWLLAVPGDHLPAAEAQRLGLTGAAGAGPEPPKSDASGPESAEPPERGAGAAAPEGTAADQARTADKAIKGPRE